jgi:putative phosphoesterase
MRIGLLSDTHIAWEQKEIPPKVLELFSDVDLILHAGDIYAHYVLDELEQLAPVLAALGDDDYLGEDSRIKEKHVIEMGGKKIWLIHEGPYFPLSPERLTAWWKNRIRPEEELYGKPDVIIAGHEHHPFVERCDGILYVNPGSPTFPDYRPVPGTIGILEIDSGEVEVEIIQL